MKLFAVFLLALMAWPAAAHAGEAQLSLDQLEKRVAQLEKAIAGRPTKLGIVSEREVLDNLEEKKDIDVDIELREKDASKVLIAVRKECETLEAEIQLHAEGSDEREAKEEQLEKKKREFALKYRKLHADVQQEATRKLDEIRMKIRAHVTRYAREHGYALVIEKDSLLFGAEGESLTTEIIDQMNAEYFEARYGEGNTDEAAPPQPE